LSFRLHRLCRVAGLSCSTLAFQVFITFGHVCYLLLISILVESEYTLAVKFDLELVKRVLAKTDLFSVSLFIFRLAESECLLVIKFELESVQAESKLCNRDNNTSYIYI
jgi:hypothetical protein